MDAGVPLLESKDDERTLAVVLEWLRSKGLTHTCATALEEFHALKATTTTTTTSIPKAPDAETLSVRVPPAKPMSPSETRAPVVMRNDAPKPEELYPDLFQILNRMSSNDSLTSGSSQPAPETQRPETAEEMAEWVKRYRQSSQPPLQIPEDSEDEVEPVEVTPLPGADKPFRHLADELSEFARNQLTAPDWSDDEDPGYRFLPVQKDAVYGSVDRDEQTEGSGEMESGEGEQSAEDSLEGDERIESGFPDALPEINDGIGPPGEYRDGDAYSTEYGDDQEARMEDELRRLELARHSSDLPREAWAAHLSPALETSTDARISTGPEAIARTAPQEIAAVAANTEETPRNSDEIGPATNTGEVEPSRDETLRIQRPADALVRVPSDSNASGGAPVGHSAGQSIVEDDEGEAPAVPGRTHSAPPVYEVLTLRVIHEINKTGFEETKDYPIEINGIIAGRYQIVEYLGSAAFSRAVQCRDLTTGQMVCIKIIKNSKDFFDQSLDEIKLLEYISQQSQDDADTHVLQLYDYFYFKEHLFLVFELLKDNLYEFSKYNRDSGGEPYFTLSNVRKISAQLLVALMHIHSLGLIHCDLKPENICFKSYSKCEVKMIDFGSSCYVGDNPGTYIQSRSYRAPEVILGLPFSQKIDVWSLGCILAELFTGQVLFQNDSVGTLLARIIGIVGPLPTHMLQNGRNVSRNFTANHFYLYDNRDEEKGGLVYIYPKATSLYHRLKTDDILFLHFISQMLIVDPAMRPSAADLLQHPWLSVVEEAAPEPTPAS